MQDVQWEFQSLVYSQWRLSMLYLRIRDVSFWGRSCEFFILNIIINYLIVISRSGEYTKLLFIILKSRRKCSFISVILL